VEIVTKQRSYMVSTVSSEYNSHCTVQHALELVNKLLVTACKEAVAVVQPF